VSLFLIAGLFLTGLAFALVGRALMLTRARAGVMLGQIGSYGFKAGQEGASDARGLYSVLDALAGLLGGIVSRRFGSGREAEVRNQLVAAGLYGTTPRKYMGYRAICAFSVPITWGWLGAAGGFPGLIVIVGAMFGVVIGWSTPQIIVRRRAERRYEQIDYELPELVDVLVVTVEAGLGFNGSLQVASERLHGPLGDELRLTLQEQSMGLSTPEALRHLLERCDTPYMRSFVRSILQGETLGVSIGQIMRNLAVDIRKRRRSAAEEKAQKAPIKLLFPLVFLIFPGMFVVLLAPAVYSFMDSF
jgi:tight adherence protein C